jgi:hypothetical protein
MRNAFDEGYRAWVRFVDSTRLFEGSPSEIPFDNETLGGYVTFDVFARILGQIVD